VPRGVRHFHGVAGPANSGIRRRREFETPHISSYSRGTGGARCGTAPRFATTEKIMRQAIALGLALSMMLVAGCSSSDSDSNGFSCDTAKSKCQNDPPLDVAFCKRAIGDANCSDVYMKAFLCIGAHQTCLPDGTTDESVIARECANEQKAAEACIPSDAGL